jgi:molybdate transport system regulatory protein
MIKIRFKFWYENDGKIFFGKGRYLLLKEIDKQGSLNKAAEALKMSYRAAWGKLKATEENLGEKLVDMSPNGAKLTSKGKQWLNMYNSTEEKIKKAITKDEDERKMNEN